MAAVWDSVLQARGPEDQVAQSGNIGFAGDNCSAPDCDFWASESSLVSLLVPGDMPTDSWLGNDTGLRAYNTSGNTTLAKVDSELYIKVAISVILGIMILITIIGNVFVIAAILLERNLQNVANYLIVSLAVADLMVACLVMPLGAVYEISQGWSLGPELCDMWTSSDVLCCAASILHLVAIAVDRYWAVTQVDYIHTRNSTRIGVMILLVWTVALVVSLAPQFGWKDPDYLHRINVQQRCLPSQDVGYQIFATCSTFYVPLLVILGLYWKIYQTARKRIHKRQALKNYVAQDNNKTKKSSGVRLLSSKRFFPLRRPASDHGAPGTPSGSTMVSALVMVEGTSTTTVLEDSTEENKADRKGSEVSDTSSAKNKEATTAFTISGANEGSSCTPDGMYLCPGNAAGMSNLSPEKSLPNTNNGSVGHRAGSPTPSTAEPGKPTPHTPTTATSKKEKKESLEAKRERKAAKTLAIITGAFVVCWLPFFIMALLMPLCETCEINPHLASFFLWLGYFNSTLNPVIYTVFSPEFRMAFKRILYGGRHPRNARGRTTFDYRGAR